MKKLIALLFAAALAVSAQAQSYTVGPSYITRSQVVTLVNIDTLTAPVITSFPVNAFQASDFGTIDPNTGAQTILGQANPPPATVNFDMLDADHKNKVVTFTYNGTSYSLPEGALVNGFGAAVAAEATPPPAHASAYPKTYRCRDGNTITDYGNGFMTSTLLN